MRRKRIQIIQTMRRWVTMIEELDREHKENERFTMSPIRMLQRQATILTQERMTADKRLISRLQKDLRTPLIQILRHHEGRNIYAMEQQYERFLVVMRELRQGHELVPVSVLMEPPEEGIWDKILTARAFGHEAEARDWCHAYFDQELRRTALRLPHQSRTERLSHPTIRMMAGDDGDTTRSPSILSPPDSPADSSTSRAVSDNVFIDDSNSDDGSAAAAAPAATSGLASVDNVQQFGSTCSSLAAPSSRSMG